MCVYRGCCVQNGSDANGSRASGSIPAAPPWVLVLLDCLGIDGIHPFGP